MLLFRPGPLLACWHHEGEVRGGGGNNWAPYIPGVTGVDRTGLSGDRIMLPIIFPIGDSVDAGE